MGTPESRLHRLATRLEAYAEHSSSSSSSFRRFLNPMTATSSAGGRRGVRAKVFSSRSSICRSASRAGRQVTSSYPLQISCKKGLRLIKLDSACRCVPPTHTRRACTHLLQRQRRELLPQARLPSFSALLVWHRIISLPIGLSCRLWCAMRATSHARHDQERHELSLAGRKKRKQEKRELVREQGGRGKCTWQGSAGPPPSGTPVSGCPEASAAVRREPGRPAAQPLRTRARVCLPSVQARAQIKARWRPL
jgi:hypothetical protein